MKLESAGLGYHVKSEDASERLGVFSSLDSANLS